MLSGCASGKGNHRDSDKPVDSQHPARYVMLCSFVDIAYLKTLRFVMIAQVISFYFSKQFMLLVNLFPLCICTHLLCRFFFFFFFFFAKSIVICLMPTKNFIFVYILKRFSS